MLDVIMLEDKLVKLLNQKQKTVHLKSSTDSYNCYLISKRFLMTKKTVFVVTPNLYEAQKYYDTLANINDPEQVLFYPADETLTSMMALGSPEFKSERLYTLNQLMSNKPFIVVTTTQGMSQRQLKPSDYKNAAKRLHKDESYHLEDLVTFLVYSGYERTFTVENPGEFSLRGHILDIFPLNNEHPFRLDFFDDILEQIKVFKVETQRSFAEVEQVEIAPIHELFYTDHMKQEAITSIKKHFGSFDLSERELDKFNQDIENLELRQKLDGLNLYIPFFNKDNTSIIDFSIEHEIYMIDVKKMKVNDEHIKNDLDTYAITMNGSAFLSISYRLPLSEILSKRHIEIDNYNISNDDAYDLNIQATNTYQS